MDEFQVSRRGLLTAAVGGCAATAGGVYLWRNRDERATDTRAWNAEAQGIEGDGETAVGAATNALLADVAESGGGVVHFPPGTYIFEETVLVGDETTVRGAGPATVFRGKRGDGNDGRALLSNHGFDAPAYSGATDWTVRDIRIDSPATNGIMPAHAERVRLKNIYGDRIRYHHIDIVSSKAVTVDGYWAKRGGSGNSDAPFQFDTQTPGTTANRVLHSGTDDPVLDDGTPTRNGTLRNFEIDPVNDPSYGVHIHRDGSESLTVRDGYIAGCQESAIRCDTGDRVSDLTIRNVSCLENARGISLGERPTGRRGLQVDGVTIRTTSTDLASGSGIFASGFDGATVSDVIVDGSFTNSILFEEMQSLVVASAVATGADRQAFRCRRNVDATFTTFTAADCGGAGLYVGPGSSVAYGGMTARNTGRDLVVDGELREWGESPSEP